MKRIYLVWATAILSLLGVGISAFTLLERMGAVSGEFCSINSKFNCDVVNSSVYSEILGLPVGLIGILGYGALLAGIFLYERSRFEWLITVMGSAALLGIAFSLYLTYIEAFVLYTWCIVCISSQVTMILVAIAILWLRRLDYHPPKTIKELHE